MPLSAFSPIVRIACFMAPRMRGAIEPNAVLVGMANGTFGEGIDAGPYSSCERAEVAAAQLAEFPRYCSGRATQCARYSSHDFRVFGERPLDLNDISIRISNSCC